MKPVFGKFALLATVVFYAFASQAQGGIEVAVQNISFTATGSTTGTLTFTIYGRKSAGYPSGGTGGLFSANLRYDLQVATNPANGGNFTLDNSSGSLSSVNSTILTGGVTNASDVPAYSPQATSSAGTNASVGFTMTRDNASDPDLPASSSSGTALFTVSYSYTITSGYAVNPVSSTFSLRTLPVARGSSWSSFSVSGNSFSAGAVALLMNLVDFTAAPTQDFRTQLNWQTSAEHDIGRFEVERSTDGAATFSKVIAAMPTEGNGSHVVNYQSYDLLPLVGDNFYRLKIVSAGGENSYSEVRKVHFAGSKAELTVYPTLNHDGIVHIRMPVEQKDMQLRLSSASGSAIPVITEGSGTERTIRLGKLPAGMYVLSVNYGMESRSFKITYQP